MVTTPEARDDLSIARPAPADQPREAGRAHLAGLGFDRLTEAGVIEHVIAASRGGQGGSIVTPNIDICRLTRRDPARRALVTGASLVVPDGMPLLWAARLRGDPLTERITGASLIFSITEAAARHGLSVFLLGGHAGVAKQAGQRLCGRFPGLKVAGSYSPPARLDAGSGNVDDIREQLAASRPAIVFVGLGFPKQELLIERLAPALPGTWFLGCGSAIPFAAGVVRRAPPWMQRTGLEWVFRLACEPRRLVGRYLLHDLPFAAWLLASCAADRLRARATAR